VFRYLRFGISIAFGWPWGCFFFLSIYAGSVAGWPGLGALALPGIAGLVGFGWITGKRVSDPVQVFAGLRKRYTVFFVFYQTLVLAATMFAALNYFVVPLLGPRAVLIASILVLFCVAFAHAATSKRIHAANVLLLLIGIVAVAVLFLFKFPVEHTGPQRPFGIASVNLLVPLALGSVIAPWADVRQWQQVVEIRRGGDSVVLAYLAGALLFGLLIMTNGALAAHLAPFMSSDDPARIYDAFTTSVSGPSAMAALAAFCVWANVSIAPTIANSYFALGQLLEESTAKSNNPLLVMIPAGIVRSPLWLLGAAALMASLAASEKLDLVWALMPFATIQIGVSACIFLETAGRRRNPDHVLCALIGSASLLILVSGYAGGAPALIVLSPLIGLIGALPAKIEAPEKDERKSPTPPPVVNNLALVAVTVVENVGSHGFEGQWFYLHITPTYDDTNSVGNVYFANYFRWVGKTRELFFNACMPDFDLDRTDFYVLTKSFHHEFRREIKEFQAVTVRIRISSYNRKFVVLAHEIRSATEGLIGRGEQSIMFVDKILYRPLDIPAVILQRFLPYYTPKL
jgi:YbgC/YbaW family acyl-CoA thioester hydrolase